MRNRLEWNVFSFTIGLNLKDSEECTLVNCFVGVV